MEWSKVARRRSLSLPDQLSVQLERMILGGELSDGEKLPSEPDLAEHFGVSRNSMRDALRELENVGLVSRRPGRGTVVVAPGSAHGGAGQALTSIGLAGTEIARIMELRALIEPPIAGLAAIRTSPRDVEQLRMLVEEMEGETDLRRYSELDRTFHQAISQYTHNPLLAQLTSMISGEIAPSRRRALQSEERRATSNAAHRRIYEAIAAGDAEHAQSEARRHVETIREHLLAASAADEGVADAAQERHG